MSPEDKKTLLQLLTKTMAAYGKPLPEAGIINAWIETLNPFPMRVIEMAFASYRAENGEFAPVPAGIAKRCTLMDGRPTDAEAWAIALTSQDESDTVVWTTEIAVAFGICRPVLTVGDEVGARMSFRDAYNRLVADARGNFRPVKWEVSFGWDSTKRESAIGRAVVAGLLDAPPDMLALPNQSGIDGPVPEGLRMVNEAIAEMRGTWVANSELRVQQAIAAREAEAKRKAEIAEMVRQYGEKGVTA